MNYNGGMYMPRTIFLLLFIILLGSCRSQKPEQAQVQDLQKIQYSKQDEIEQLRQAGAEIVVQESDYVIIQTTKMLHTHSFPTEPIDEKDLVQRLINIHLKDSTDIQKVVDLGVDLWEIRGDTAVARVFDIHIKNLQEYGLSVDIVAEDAGKMDGREEK